MSGDGVAGVDSSSTTTSGRALRLQDNPCSARVFNKARKSTTCLEHPQSHRHWSTCNSYSRHQTSQKISNFSPVLPVLDSFVEW